MTGLLLINLGTPAAPRPREVRRYLREFLSDPYVIDINPVGRWLLLNLLILPFRPKQSAEAYEKVWHAERGSPLLYHSRDLADAVRARIGNDWTVALGMRYGEPAIRDALASLRDAGVERIVVLPLYPQYALSSTATSIETVKREVAALWGGEQHAPALEMVESFYDHAAFLRAFAEVGRPVLASEQPDHVLFSFHGLPERHLTKLDPTGHHCLASAGCCTAITDTNQLCYRAHCFATARALAAELELPRAGWTMSFQSRLGRTRWIRPYTDELVVELAGRGVRRLAVFCPAFVADCLETLEEIGMRAAQSFREAGGEQLTLVPSLNSSPAWVEAVCRIATEAAA